MLAHTILRAGSPHHTGFPEGVCWELSLPALVASSHPLLSAASLTSGQVHEPPGRPPRAPVSVDGAGSGDADSPSNSPSGSARRAAGRLAGLRTSPAVQWRHCGSWRGSVGAVGEGRRWHEAPAARPAGQHVGQGWRRPQASLGVKLKQPVIHFPLCIHPTQSLQDGDS